MYSKTKKELLCKVNSIRLDDGVVISAHDTRELQNIITELKGGVKRIYGERGADNT